jgi:hypothetical protein
LQTVTDKTNPNYGEKFGAVEIGGTELEKVATISSGLTMKMMLLMNVT